MSHGLLGSQVSAGPELAGSLARQPDRQDQPTPLSSPKVAAQQLGRAVHPRPTHVGHQPRRLSERELDKRGRHVTGYRKQPLFPTQIWPASEKSSTPSSPPRGGDFDALVAVLDPDVVLRADLSAVHAGGSRVVRGGPAVARRAAKGRARATRPALVNGNVEVVVAPRGRLLMVLGFTSRGQKIVEIDAIADPARLNRLDLVLLDD